MRRVGKGAQAVPTFKFRALKGGRASLYPPYGNIQSIAATTSISTSQPGRASRLTTTSVLAGGFAVLR